MFQEFERALNLPDHVDSNARIANGRLDVPMAEQVLDHANVDALFE
jgi:HSP20 family molecular chaperone IbpA